MKTKGTIFALLFLVGCEGVQLVKVCEQPWSCLVDAFGKAVPFNGELLGECHKGTVTFDSDCNPTCPDYQGPIPEICDSLDQDCNGFVDDGFDIDGDGFSSCGGDCNDNDWAIYPGAVEYCNNIDENCNGNIDENVTSPCSIGSGLVSFDEEVSRCRPGTTVCTAGVWGACIGAVGPLPQELCNGVDDDCDGLVDEVQLASCGPVLPRGLCRRGDRVCAPGGETYCVNATYPTQEACNGFDDDCDGLVDEELSQPCRTACGVGTEYCSIGRWANCDATQPQMEVCDGIDNDCNGIADEGCLCSLGESQVCRNNIFDMSTGQPITCGIGISLCDASGVWGPCYAFGTQPETCNNWDDDCAGGVDDGLTRSCGDPNTAGVGECRLGTVECVGGSWGPCVDMVAPTTEQCDHLDNDCDFEIDEDLQGHSLVDMFFVIDGSGSMCFAVMALQTGLSAYSVDFAGTQHRFGVGVYPGNSGIVDVLIPLTDFASFSAQLGSYNCNYGGIEPAWDASALVMGLFDPLGIGWRVGTGTVTGAYPYVVVIGDEDPDQGVETEADLTILASTCSVGGCQPGDRFETFVITPTTYWSKWDGPTFGEPGRLIDLFPSNGARYTDVLRGVFSNVCR